MTGIPAPAERRAGASGDGSMPIQAAILYRAVFDSAVDVAMVVTGIDGRVTAWNVGAERVLGWSAAEMLGEPADRFFTPQDRAVDRPAAEMGQALSEGRASDERWYLRKDGSCLWASGELTPLRDDAGGHIGFLKILRDRTEARQAGDALRASEARLQRAQEAGGVGVFSLDMDDDVLHATPEFFRLYGLPVRDSFPAGEIDRLIHPDDVDLRSASASRAAGTVSRDVEYRIRRADTGAVRWIARRGEFEHDEAGRRVRFVGVVRDVTAQAEADRALREGEARRTTLLELNDRLRDITDPADLTFTACEVLGTVLDVSRVGYGVIDKVAETITIERDWNAPGIRSLAGVLHFRDYGTYVEDLKRGETAIVSDAARDPRTRANAGALEGISARAFVNMPLVEQGRSVAVLYANHAVVRAWSEGEVALMREVAERVRVATERLRSERALRESEEQFRVFAQAVPNQVWAARPDGHLYWFNRQAYAYSGGRPGSMDGTSAWGRIVHPDDLPAAGQAWARSLAAGEVYETEFRIRRADGAYRWFLVRAEPVRAADGRITLWVGTNTDIDDKRRQAAELAHWNATLEQRVEERTRERDRTWSVSQDMMVVVDAAGTFRAVSPAATRILGWEPGEMLGRTVFAFTHPDDIDLTVSALAEATGAELARIETRYRHRDGSYRWLAWTAAPEGDLVYATGRHVTAEKEQAEALLRIEEQLRQSQKMEAVGQLTGGLAHDFNNLLAGISGSLELLQTRMNQGRLSDLDRYINAAQGASKRAAALTHRLLAFSRRQTLDPKPTSVNGLVAGMEDLIRRTVGPAVHVEVVGAPGLWPALVDPPQLENALLNLCINARDAMPDGGRITIETANKWLDDRGARERDLAPGQYLSLCVTDTGTGMPPDVVARAFDPFFTTKPIGQGTGLGLSMIYGFARQSGGQVRIYSELGQGTTMCVYLPRHYGEAEHADVMASLGEAPRAEQGQTVLIVDDEPTVRMLVSEVLEDLGYTAIEAADGPAGLKVLRSDVRIDLLVTDVGLPGGMNGRQMADAGRVVRPGLRVLFITGYAENAVVGNGHLDPGMAVLTKPFVMEALASRIRDLIAST